MVVVVVGVQAGGVRTENARNDWQSQVGKRKPSFRLGRFPD